MTFPDGYPAPKVMREVHEVYDSLAETVETRELELTAPPLQSQNDTGGVSESLHLPMDLWNQREKPPRTVPALVAYDQYISREQNDDLIKICVGLDVLITMLDQFIDTRELGWEQRIDIAANIAFASLLSFSTVPSTKRAEAVEMITRFLVKAARIPQTERAVQRKLRTVASPEAAIPLLRRSYAHRARDISVFGSLPALFYNVDERTAACIERDLETYRVHYLLFDDIRDIREDIRNGTETPVTWLLSECETPESVMSLLVEVYQEFEYSESPYRTALRELEREPDDLQTLVSDAMNTLNTELATARTTIDT